jgi:hypothetical protein
MTETTTTKPKAAEPLAEKAPRSEKALRSLPIRVAQWTSAGVAFLATLLGVVFVLFPALKPTGPPTTKAATLSDAVQEQLNWGQYLDRTAGLSRASYDASALQRRGIYVSFHFSIDGYDGKQLPLRYQLLDAQTGDQLGQSSGTLIVPTARSDSGVWPVWVPLPPGPPKLVYVQLQLYDDTGIVPLDSLRTPAIRAAAG